jgi:hypothetical protein
VQDGSRNQTLCKLAGHLIANGNDPLVIRELMLGWNRGMCDPPLADTAIVQIVENLCARELAKSRWIS